MEKKYKNEDITVIWDNTKCVHSKNCFKGLSQVFNPAQRPWINLGASDSKTIMKQIDFCPSGALSYVKNNEEPKAEKTTALKKGSAIAEKQPAQVFVEEGKNYLWCACGKSVNQPFCDNTHELKSDLRPMLLKPLKTGDAWLCQCKQTNNPPYCDGTHNKL